MFPAPFDYRSARSVDEALEALARGGDDARVLAGGQSLIPAMRFRLARPSLLVDINPIKELAYLKEDGGVLKIGALTRHADIEHSKLINDKYRVMQDVAYVVGTARSDELDALCLSQIARFKRPKDYVFVPSLPKNNYGKILKTELRALDAKGVSGG